VALKTRDYLTGTGVELVRAVRGRRPGCMRSVEGFDEVKPSWRCDRCGLGLVGCPSLDGRTARRAITELTRTARKGAQAVLSMFLVFHLQHSARLGRPLFPGPGSWGISTRREPAIYRCRPNRTDNIWSSLSSLAPTRRALFMPGDNPKHPERR
jgi:hypothetical protein